MVAMATLLYGFLWAYFIAENKRRGAGKRNAKIVGKTEEEIAEMGDENPRFVYPH